ncbi:prolyl-tRNA synthetase [Micractinium conductrix]|uniref:proline--tRNA ligase n=1 Tax=Micractinium conductrix TaxID=554055 RepID=A0A2P6VDL1_9CHLO|nr:prolyl-tRNA synthetase [Micractinium conductrix]|eukprot:PSC72151.1 prolyl-tRNA synthetase [Micractinium conductrix]
MSLTRTLVPGCLRGSAWLARAVQRSSSRQATRLNRLLVSAAAQAEAAEPQAGGKQQKQQQKQKQQKQQGGSKKGEAKAITPKSEDFSRWYLDVVRECQLADYGPVRGTMVIRPYGYAIWEGVQTHLDKAFKETGHQNAYFPQLIPLSFLQKEADHVEGFAPELALVTQGGGKELEEPLVVRPTSETIVNHMFAQWVQSYRDLPLLINQWANVHRWEMRTRPFVRTLEFLWQEGHTAHATPEEAEEETIRMLRIYEDFAWNVAAMPVVAGRKSRIESFAGANCTYTIEAMMGDRRALQAGTSHNLGDNFAKAFGTRYLDEAGQLQFVHQSSWGVSTRMVGGIIMTHGDDAGLRLPPRLAPIQVVIVPIIKKDVDASGVTAAVAALETALKAAGGRVKVDASTDKTPGWKFNQYEMKGVPLRVEVGPRDVEQGTCVAARRDVRGKEGKQMGVPLEPQAFVAYAQGLLDEIQAGMLAQAKEFRDSNIVDVGSYAELQAAVAEGKWARGPWAGCDDDERRVKEETSATLRCFPFEQPQHSGVCFMTGQPATEPGSRPYKRTAAQARGAKNITTGFSSFAFKSLAVSWCSGTVFGLASWMVFQGPLGPALSFLSGTGFGFIGGLVSTWRTDAHEVLLLTRKFPALIEHHVRISEAGHELEGRTFDEWAADLARSPRKQGIAIAAMYSAAPALDRIRQESEDALVAAYCAREAEVAAASAGSTGSADDG